MPDPFDISSEDRKAVTENENCEGTYGEVVFEHFAALLNQIGVKEGQVFWDLGCGAGKPLAIASLMHPELKACKGVEYYPGLAQLARQGAEALKGKGAPIEIHEGDMFCIDWQSDADIVYMSNLCFTPEMNERLAGQCSTLRPGTIVIALKLFKDDWIKAILKYEKMVTLNMSWGSHEAKLYVKL